MIFLVVFLHAASAVNPHLNNLIETIRGNYVSNADSNWTYYIASLTRDKLFSENTQQLGGLANIKEYEVKFAEGHLTEAEFCQQIGLEFSKDGAPIEAEWFLNKAESLGFINSQTYFARASNYAREWNSFLHYNEELSGALESKWHEALTKFISISKESTDIYRARLELTSIYDPFRTPIFIDSLAPQTISNLEEFINKYPENPCIELAYERLVWWLYETESYTKLCAVCKSFLNKHPNARNTEYIKFQLGNAYFFLNDFDRAKKIYSSVKQNLVPDSVYPGWGGQYILNELNDRLAELENRN